METFILNSWRNYRTMVRTLKGGSRVNEEELREAYFTGAAVLFQRIMTSLDPGEEPTAEDMRKMEAIHQEVTKFGQEIDRKYGRKLLKRLRRQWGARFN